MSLYRSNSPDASFHVTASSQDNHIATSTLTTPTERAESFVLNLLTSLVGTVVTGNDSESVFAQLPKLHEQLLVLSHLYHYLFLPNASCTQRDIYYHLSQFFPDQQAVCNTLLQVGKLLNCSRQELHVRAGQRGYVGGCLTIEGQHVTSMGQQGAMIDGRLAMCAPPEGPPCGHVIYTPIISLENAKCIIIVEKDAVFQRLMSERIFDYFPCVVVTGMGFPPLSVQAFVRYLADISQGSLRIVGLVDFNPSGLHILLQYLRGSKRFSGGTFAVSDVKWLGLRSKDLSAIDRSLVHPYNDRDKAMIKRLLSLKGGQALPPLWAAEVEWMAHHHLKADIECLYQSGTLGSKQSFSRLIAQRIMQNDFI